MRFEGTDALIEEEGPQAAAAELGALVADVQRAVDERQVCFLESDVDVDGGKLMLTAGRAAHGGRRHGADAPGAAADRRRAAGAWPSASA